MGGFEITLAVSYAFDDPRLGDDQGGCPNRGSGGLCSLLDVLVSDLGTAAACAKLRDFATVLAAKFPMAEALPVGRPIAAACAAIIDDACVTFKFL